MGDNRQIAIIGFKGCGKSTVGKMLAKKLGRQFQDTDDILEELYLAKNGEKLGFREIYVRHGRGVFENLEIEALNKALEGEDKVISFGGGALMTMDSRGIEAQNAIMVYLTAESGVLFDRIIALGIPAFFTTTDPRDSFEQLLEKRRPIYERYANITIDNSYISPEQTVDEVIEALKEKSLI
ncbi:MAG: hypothetical protein OEZ55_00690 [Nitrospinota bacterium]|nr:hypothetical protein [Nitrospinota bacterium]